MSHYYNCAILTTPLQANYFMQVHPDPGIAVFYLQYKVGDKDVYYTDLLREKGYEVTLIETTSRDVIDDFVKKFTNLKTLYVASVDHLVVQLLCEKFKDLRLISFDDGTINIAQNHQFHKNPALQDVKKRIVTHYTYFDGVPNIVEEARLVYKPIKFEFPDEVGEGDCHIYLSQPFAEEPVIVQYGEMLRKRYPSLTHHFPHPRLSKLDLGLVNIETPFIFEDYLVKLLRDYERVIVYTLCSTSEYLLKDIERITFISLDKGNVLHRRLGLPNP